MADIMQWLMPSLLTSGATGLLSRRKRTQEAAAWQTLLAQQAAEAKTAAEKAATQASKKRRRALLMGAGGGLLASLLLTRSRRNALSSQYGYGQPSTYGYDQYGNVVAYDQYGNPMSMPAGYSPYANDPYAAYGYDPYAAYGYDPYAAYGYDPYAGYGYGTSVLYGQPGAFIEMPGGAADSGARTENGQALLELLYGAGPAEEMEEYEEFSLGDYADVLALRGAMEDRRSRYLRPGNDGELLPPPVRIPPDEIDPAIVESPAATPEVSEDIFESAYNEPQPMMRYGETYATDRARAFRSHWKAPENLVDADMRDWRKVILRDHSYDVPIEAVSALGQTEQAPGVGTQIAQAISQISEAVRASATPIAESVIIAQAGSRGITPAQLRAAGIISGGTVAKTPEEDAEAKRKRLMWILLALGGTGLLMFGMARYARKRDTRNSGKKRK